MKDFVYLMTEYFFLQTMKDFIYLMMEHFILQTMKNFMHVMTEYFFCRPWRTSYISWQSSFSATMTDFIYLMAYYFFRQTMTDFIYISWDSTVSCNHEYIYIYIMPYIYIITEYLFCRPWRTLFISLQSTFSADHNGPYNYISLQSIF